MLGLRSYFECNENTSIFLPESMEAIVFKKPYEYWLLSVVQPSIAIPGIVLNLLLLAIIVKNKGMRTITNIYLGNLAISDVIFLTFHSTTSFINAIVQPFSKNLYFLGPRACVIYCAIFWGTYHFSLFIVTIISVDRFLAICYPFAHRRVAGKSRTIKIVIACLIVSLSLTAVFFPFVGYNIEHCWEFESIGFVPHVVCWPIPALQRTYLPRQVIAFLELIPFCLCFAGNVFRLRFYFRWHSISATS